MGTHCYPVSPDEFVTGIALVKKKEDPREDLHSDAVRKPIDLDELAETVQRVLPDRDGGG